MGARGCPQRFQTSPSKGSASPDPQGMSPAPRAGSLNPPTCAPLPVWVTLPMLPLTIAHPTSTQNPSPTPAAFLLLLLPALSEAPALLPGARQRGELPAWAPRGSAQLLLLGARLCLCCVISCGNANPNFLRHGS